MVSFFPNCFSRQKTLHQHQLPPIIPSFFCLAFQGEGALVLATTLYLEATLIIVRSRTAHETKVKAKLIAGAPTPPCRHFPPFLPRIIQKIHGRRFWRSGSLTEAVPVGPGCRRRRRRRPQRQYGKTCRNNSGGPATTAAAGRPRGKPNLFQNCVRCCRQAANLAVRPQDIPLLTTESWLRGVCANHQ